ncbi:MAG: DUF3303 domain-containing protein [Candidatus Hodarchaeales archaeon]|jgi:hypothetical protein
MKYIVFWEFEAKDFEICAKKYANLPEEMAAKSLSENFVVLGESRGFQLLETDDPLVISKLALYYGPETDFTVQPIIEATQVMEAFKQLKS